MSQNVVGASGGQQQASDAVARPMPERFMVGHQGYALLGADGEEKERLDSMTSGAGAISPDGRWMAFPELEPGPPPGDGTRQRQIVIQSRVSRADRRVLPMVWGTGGLHFQPIWSSDSKRILLCERGQYEDRSQGTACRLYDLGSTSVKRLPLSDNYWPSDWSADGKRILTSVWTGSGSFRVAWAPIDGGEPEFLTSDKETAYDARLSPDNRRILCEIGSRAPNDDAIRSRLYVIDLVTKKRTAISKPGHANGHCWSSDGSKIAYTWQMPLRNPAEVVERKTYLITCDQDGSDQKTITMRKYDVPQNGRSRPGVVVFFKVMAWWR